MNFQELVHTIASHDFIQEEVQWDSSVGYPRFNQIPSILDIKCNRARDSLLHFAKQLHERLATEMQMNPTLAENESVCQDIEKVSDRLVDCANLLPREKSWELLVFSFAISAFPAQVRLSRRSENYNAMQAEPASDEAELPKTPPYLIFQLAEDLNNKHLRKVVYGEDNAETLIQLLNCDLEAWQKEHDPVLLSIHRHLDKLSIHKEHAARVTIEERIGEIRTKKTWPTP